MPRSVLTTVLTTGLVALALAASTLVVAPTAAQAAWSRPGDLVKYRVCKTGAGDHWILTSRVRKYWRTPDARASLSAWSGGRASATAW